MRVGAGGVGETADQAAKPHAHRPDHPGGQRDHGDRPEPELDGPLVAPHHEPVSGRHERDLSGRPPAAQEVAGLEADGDVEDRPDAPGRIAEELDGVCDQDRREGERGWVAQDGRRSSARRQISPTAYASATSERIPVSFVCAEFGRTVSSSATVPPTTKAYPSERARSAGPGSESFGAWVISVLLSWWAVEEAGPYAFTRGISTPREGRFNRKERLLDASEPAQETGENTAQSRLAVRVRSV